MTNFTGIWKTSHVLIELKMQGKNLVLQRTRGKKQKTKSVYLKPERLTLLVKAVFDATVTQPQEQLQNRFLVGLVDGGSGLITVSWEPYLYGTCNALMIREERAIAIEQDSVLAFALWLGSQQLLLEEMSRPKLAKG